MSNPRVALLGFILETNAFAPIAYERDFFWTEGEAILADARSDTPRDVGGFVGFVRAMDAAGPWRAVPLLMANGEASGPMDQAFLDRLLARVERDLRAQGPFDGVYIQDHGAAGATADDDPDGTLFQLVRRVVGPDVPVVVTLDLHGNVSKAMVAATDVLITYVTNPHVDMVARGEEAAHAMRELLGGVHTERAFIKVPILPPQVALLTDRGPYGETIDLGQQRCIEPIMNVSVMGNFSFADSPKTGMSVIVTSRGDALAANTLCRELAETLWSQRHRFTPAVLSIEETTRLMRAVCDDPASPSLLFADVADNPGGGGRGNTTDILRAFLDAGIRNVMFAVQCDAGLAAEAHRLGAGTRFTARLNRDEAHEWSKPLQVDAEVMGLSDGEIVGRRGSIGGHRCSLGPSAWLQLDRRIDMIAITFRQQCLDTEMIEHLGPKVRDYRGVVLKSRGHFRAGFDDIFADRRTLEVDAPGLTTPVLTRVPWRNLHRPIWPLDPDLAWQAPQDAVIPRTRRQ